MFRLLPLLVSTVGVAMCFSAGHHGNGETGRPIILASQQLRICADLCQSGLGGEPCGDVCMDLLPKQMPVQLAHNTAEGVAANTRVQACPVLCKNRLGYPFCQCETQPVTTKYFEVDFHEICDHYCEKENWLLKGCPDCENEKAKHAPTGGFYKQDGRLRDSSVKVADFMYQSSQEVDWGKWCNMQCANSNGGSACNCDILPFSLKL